MSKYILPRKRPACPRLRQAFWLAVWLSISPMAMPSDLPPGNGSDKMADTGARRFAPDPLSGSEAQERGLADPYRSPPPAMKIPVIILWDESGKTARPGAGPVRFRASITTCNRSNGG